MPTPAHDELVVTLRVNNNALCNLGAVVAFADKAPDGTRLKSPRGRFLRYTFAPGWGGIAGVGEAGRGGIQLPRKIIIINYLFLLDV